MIKIATPNPVSIKKKDVKDKMSYGEAKMLDYSNRFL